jgi:hypothetical protein
VKIFEVTVVAGGAGAVGAIVSLLAQWKLIQSFAVRDGFDIIEVILLAKATSFPTQATRVNPFSFANKLQARLSSFAA